MNNLKYQIHWIDNFENSEKEKCQTYSILLDLPEICTVKDCIVMSINELNKILEKKDISYSLIDNPKHYELFISKKNGMPKEDYPCKKLNCA